MVPRAPRGFQRRRSWTATPFAALDFETTGLDFDRDRIVSFGVVPIDGGVVRELLGAYSLVDPGPVPVSDVSRAIHGLGPEELRDAPPANVARASLRDALAGRVLITWNGIVEAAFLARLFGTSARTWLRRSVDVRWFVIALLGPDAAALTLSEAAARFDVPVTAPHHALDDALVTANLFVATATALSAGGGLRSTRDAMRIGRARGLTARRSLIPR
jgi:DNA polymerase-3 subunit epsilon